jgi:hypothetical protein
MPVLDGLNFQVTVASDGAYSISTGENGRPILKAEITAKINHQWVQSSDYPDHQVALTRFHDSLGAGTLAKVSFTGLSSEPDLSYRSLFQASSSTAQPHHLRKPPNQKPEPSHRWDSNNSGNPFR